MTTRPLPSAASSQRQRKQSTCLYADPTPLATEGDWAAYLDEETTGYIYYFNGVTGESVWEKPTKTFPDVTAAADGSSTNNSGGGIASGIGKKDEGGGGLFGAIFGKDKSSIDEKKKGLDVSKIATNNDEFLSELDIVIAEAEEAIKIAESLESSPKKGLFSRFGGGSGAKEAEELIADAEERTSKIAERVEKKSIFSSFSFGSKAAEVEEVVVEEEVVVAAEENVWVEGLKNLFQRTYDSFNPPKTKTTPEKKMVAIQEPSVPKEKAQVSDSDFLDVIWGAETSSRPTLNIAEMMKAFQVETKEKSGPVEEVSEEFRTVSLDMALQVKPHPEKVSWGGEDAGFVNVHGRTFGVFDGVSGAEKVKGKKLYSFSLADSMKKKSGGNKNGLSVGELTEFMTQSKEVADTEGTGASTAVVASIGEDNVLRALNLGDSVCLVVRDGKVAARTREIIHYFDCPYQLGEDSPDRPKDGTTLQADIFPGDVIVAGSDGVFDNLSDADVIELVSACPPKANASVIAKKIVEQSRMVSLDSEALTPYSRAARGRSGYASYQTGRGGKVDDVSCIVVKAS